MLMQRAFVNAILVGAAFLLIIVAQPSSTWSIPTIPYSDGPQGAGYNGVRKTLNDELLKIKSREDKQVKSWITQRDEIIDLIDAGVRVSKKFRRLPAHIKIMILVGGELAPDAVAAHFRSKIRGLVFDNNAFRGQAGNRARTAKRFCDGLPTTWPEGSGGGGGGSNNYYSFESNPNSMFNQSFNWNAYWSGSTVCDYSSIGGPQRC